MMTGGVYPMPRPLMPVRPMTAKAPEHLVEAIRIELKKLVEMPDLDVHLGEIARVAHQADDLLVCLKSPEAVMQGEHAIMVPGGGPLMPNNPETYGATMLRQLVEAFSSKKKDAADDLVEALATARREGMTDVAAELEQKLLGKKLEGEKPVGAVHSSLVTPTAEDYLKKVAEEDKAKKVDRECSRCKATPISFEQRTAVYAQDDVHALLCLSCNDRYFGRSKDGVAPPSPVESESESAPSFDPPF